MNRFFASLLLASVLEAGPIYRITFEGEISTGTASTLDQPTLVELNGLTISGVIDYDLGLAPAPTFETPPIGFPSGTGTRFESATDPVWIIRQTVSIQGLPGLGSGFTSPFEFPVVPVPPTGTLASPSVRDQRLISTASLSSTVLTSTTFRDDWTDGELTRFRSSFLGFNVSSTTPFLLDMPGLQPFLATTDVVGGGAFSMVDFEWTRTNPFFTTSNRIDARFTITSAQGEFVTPEPATLALTGIAMLALMARRRSIGG